jgi:hypothetical protein
MLVVPMDPHTLRFPTDMWRAFELTGQREQIPTVEVLRIGGLSYSSFSMARAGVEPSAVISDEAAAVMWDLFVVARVVVWPL